MPDSSFEQAEATVNQADTAPYFLFCTAGIVYFRAKVNKRLENVNRAARDKN